MGQNLELVVAQSHMSLLDLEGGGGLAGIRMQ